MYHWHCPYGCHVKLARTVLHARRNDVICRVPSSSTVHGVIDLRRLQVMVVCHRIRFCAVRVERHVRCMTSVEIKGGGAAAYIHTLYLSARMAAVVVVAMTVAVVGAVVSGQW
jgi:hypothetical protein